MDWLLELLDDGITGWLGGLLGRDRGSSWQGTVPICVGCRKAWLAGLSPIAIFASNSFG